MWRRQRRLVVEERREAVAVRRRSTLMLHKRAALLVLLLLNRVDLFETEDSFVFLSPYRLASAAKGQRLPLSPEKASCISRRARATPSLQTLARAGNPIHP